MEVLVDREQGLKWFPPRRRLVCLFLSQAGHDFPIRNRRLDQLTQPTRCILTGGPFGAASVPEVSNKKINPPKLMLLDFQLDCIRLGGECKSGCEGSVARNDSLCLPLLYSYTYRKHIFSLPFSSSLIDLPILLF